MAVHKPMTVEEFDQFANLPENSDRILEYIGGEIVEVPSHPYASKVDGIHPVPSAVEGLSP